MALDLSGISKLGGYLLANEGPLDVRTVVPSKANLTDLVTGRIAYAGMIVYVQNEDTHYTYNGETWATLAKSPETLTIGNQTYNGSEAVAVTAANLGLANALHFIGTTTTKIADDSTTATIKVNDTDHTAVAGDVVLYNSNEYVFDGSKWLELGDGSSHALKTVQIAAGTGLTGGGTISSNVTIGHAVPDGAAKGEKGDTANRTYIKTVTTDDFGHVTGVETGTETVTDTGATSIEVTGDGNAITAASYSTSDRKITLTKGATYNNYSLPAAGESLGGVKSGGDVTISNGIISVTNDSHSHTKIPNALSLANSDNSTYYAMTAQSYNAMSDARLKENFEPFVNDKSILDLPIYKYDYINGAKNQIGCKAQDLQEICPEIVNEGSDGYLSIQESKIVYLLLNEVKKLRQEVDELKRR